MRLSFRRALLISASIATFASIHPAFAADSSEASQIKKLQAQLQALQDQLNQLQADQKATKTEVAKVEATETQEGTTSKSPIKYTFGGYVEAGGIYRSSNENADLISNFNSAIPLNNVANAHQSEFRGTARGTRLTALAEGNVDANDKLIAYLEGDFLGSTNATSTETNSYSPRIRQGFAGYEASDWGLNVYGGQTWSLLTLNKSGLNPRSEALYPMIDVSTMVGFTYTRTPGLRVVKTFGNDFALAFAAESPQLNSGGVTAPATVTTTTSTSSVTLGTTSTDVAPDMILKAAYDSSIGHYEAFTIGRFFHDNVNVDFHNNVVFGGGGGLGAFIPVTKAVDIQGNVVAGQGIGRYGPALLPDVAFRSDGSIKPLTEFTANLGVTVRPSPTWTAYAAVGGERELRYNSGTSGTTYGYGTVTGLNNAGCYVNNGTCNAQTSSVWEVTGGFWKDIYKGNYGNMKVGLQDELIRRNTFADGSGNAPHALEQIVLTSFRYSPF